MGGGGSTMRSNASHGTPCEKTNRSENITFRQLPWRAVKIDEKLLSKAVNQLE